MKRKMILKKFIIILILAMSCLVIIPSFTNAMSFTEIKSMADNFLSVGSSNAVDDSKIKDIVIPIGQMVVVVGNIVIAIGITYIGICYMIAQPEKKAKVKEQLIGLMVAAVVIYGAQIIWSFTYNFMENLFS